MGQYYKKMKKTSIVVSIIVVLVIGAMAFTLATNKKTLDSRKATAVNQTEVAVSTVTAEKKQANGDMKMIGTTQAFKEVSIASEIAGKIVQVNFKMGDFVNKGKVLAKIDDTYKRLAYENAKLNYDKCKDDYTRYTTLRRGDAISDTQMRDIKMALDNAAIQLENAKKQLDDTRVVAPFSGYITAQNAELGAYVNPGTPVAYIADIANLKVMLDVSETNAYQLSQGQSVLITADVQPDMQLQGRISAIGQKASASHTYPVEILITNNGKEKLKAGTYVNVTIGSKSSGTVLMIPRDAIVSSVKDPAVYVVRNGKAYLTEVTIGRNFESELEVLNGIAAGDKVVTSGQINLSNGSKVTMIN
jgi:RND family efflux transporter MFP subunit